MSRFHIVYFTKPRIQTASLDSLVIKPYDKHFVKSKMKYKMSSLNDRRILYKMLIKRNKILLYNI